jgi:hypothetical protein
MRKIWNVAALSALIASPAMAQTPNSANCLTHAEANALFTFALPEMLESVRGKCAASLPRTSYLATQGEQLVARHRAASASSWPPAKAAFVKMAVGDDPKIDTAKILSSLPDETLRSVITTGLNVGVTEDFKPGDCPKADRIIEALAPLPASNLAAIIVEIVSLSASKDPKAPIRICEAS